jgi:hypothetical protein
MYNTTINSTHGPWLINSKSLIRIHRLVISINYVCLIITHGLWLINSKSLIRIHQLVISINYVCLIITHGPWLINSKSLIRIYQLVIKPDSHLSQTSAMPIVGGHWFTSFLKKDSSQWKNNHPILKKARIY